jgi:hypothetical protein
VRESISKLGVESELDQIEGEFREDFKEKTILDAKNEIFPQVGPWTQQFSLKLKELLDKSKKQRDTLRSLEFKLFQISEDTSEPDHDGNAWSDIVEKYRGAINDHLHSVLGRAYAHLVKVHTEYNAKLGEIRAKRRKRFQVFGLVAGTISVILYLGLRYANFVPEQTLVLILITGVVSNLIGDAIGLGIAKYTDKSPEKIATLQKDFQRKLLVDCEQIIENELTGFRLSGISAGSISDFVANAWGGEIEGYKKTIFAHDGMQGYGSVKACSAEYLDLTRSYIALTNEIAKAFGAYFRNIDTNLTKLQNISKSISTVAIEPSFTLLEKTHLDLSAASEAIANATFS